MRVQGPILAFVYAVKEMLKEGRGREGSLPVNVAFVFEGEEENGSAGFREAVQANLHWFEGTQLIVISNTLWVGEEASCRYESCCRVGRTSCDLEIGIGLHPQGHSYWSELPCSIPRCHGSESRLQLMQGCACASPELCMCLTARCMRAGAVPDVRHARDDCRSGGGQGARQGPALRQRGR